jgi:hypothetical protein
MPTSTYVALATVTLASTDSEIVFSSIPATYRDLVLVTNFAESAVTGNIELRYNSDTGSNYSQVFMAGREYNSSAESSSGTFSLHYLNVGSRASGARSVNVLQIMDYSATQTSTKQLWVESITAQVMCRLMPIAGRIQAPSTRFQSSSLQLPLLLAQHSACMESRPSYEYDSYRTH